MTTPAAAILSYVQQQKPTVLSIDYNAFIQTCLRDVDSEQLDEAELREWCSWSSKSRDVREKRVSSKTMAQLDVVSKNWDRILLSTHKTPLNLTPTSTPAAALKDIFEEGYALARSQDASGQVFEADVWSKETVEVYVHSLMS